MPKKIFSRYVKIVVPITTNDIESQILTGIDCQSALRAGFIQNGIININPKKKVHFITVIALYFINSGFKRTIYKAYDMEFIIMNKFPVKVSDLKEIEP